METNCLDIDTAAAEMQAVAALNPRIKDPVYHFLVSLKKGERLPILNEWTIGVYPRKK